MVHQRLSSAVAAAVAVAAAATEHTAAAQWHELQKPHLGANRVINY